MLFASGRADIKAKLGLARAPELGNLPVMAVTTDDIRVQQVQLNYRVAGTSAYIFLPMDQTAFRAYTALIPASAVTPLGLEYFIIARDSKGNLTSGFGG